MLFNPIKLTLVKNLQSKMRMMNLQIFFKQKVFKKVQSRKTNLYNKNTHLHIVKQKSINKTQIKNKND